MDFPRDVVVVGGCGRAGLPLALAFADAGLRTSIFDIDDTAVATVAAGTMPFLEDDADAALSRALADGSVSASTDPATVAEAETVVIVVGTEIDEYLSPDPQGILRTIDDLRPNLRDGQLMILRSTVYPGVTRLVEQRIAKHGLTIDIAFCPERIVEGKAMRELRELPQIVSARSPEAARRAEALFSRLTGTIVPLAPEEAELAKLFTNVWRYTKFAITNQFFMIANDYGLDYERIRAAMAENYPRAADIPGAGFAAGPCLLKDTMQLSAFTDNNFILGHASMLINEGLPAYVAAQIGKRFELQTMTVGILGMAFKGGSDDKRSSLAYKLRRILRVQAAEVLATDPLVHDDGLLPLQEVLARADLLIIGAPHAEYADLDAGGTPLIDIWNLRGDGARV